MTQRSVPMLDLATEFNLFADEVRSVVNTVLESQQFINGPAIAALEKQLADRTGARDAIAVNSGTDALLVALMALDLKPGDEVIVPAFTFFATAGAVWRLGGKPVFVDIDEKTFNIDPAAVESAITERTRAIMPVHLYGQCADMDAIQAIAARRNIAVIEDAAQAINATYNGRQACTMGALACMSFYPTKNLGGFGEGGMVFANDERLGTLVRQLRHHGESERYIHERVGGNFRLDTMKAAILLVKLHYLDEFTRRRQAIAARYDELLGRSIVSTPQVVEGCGHVYHQYTIQTERRDDLRAFLQSQGVSSAVYYPVPLHLQPCFAPLGYRRGDLPVSERVCGRVLSLPCHPMLEDDDIEYVASCVLAFGESAPAPAGAASVARQTM